MKPIDSKKLRKVAGAFATGITVVTVEKTDGTVKGMTANSFLSVSLSPPLVSFSIQENGSMIPHLQIGKAIGISILSDQQQAVSDQFAGRNNSPIEIRMTQPTAGVHIIKDCLAWYSTTVQSILAVGDHLLIVCRVVDLDRVENGSPLLYYSGYQKIGF